VNNSCGTTSTVSFAVTGQACRLDAKVEPAAFETLLNAFPNPTNGKLNITFNSAAKQKYVLKVMDLAGKALMFESVIAEEGRNLHQIDLIGVAKGMYILSIEGEGTEIQTIRIVVE